MEKVFDSRSSMASFSIWTLAAFVAAFATLGCMRQQDLESARDFSPGIQQNDIPVPLHFQFDKEKSYSLIKYSSGVGNFRSWIGYYYGDQQVANLAHWYQQQMGVDGWTYKDTRQEMEKKRIHFLKGDETATIWLYREFDHRSDRFHTVVKAEIHPTPIHEMAPEELLSTESQVAGAAREGRAPEAAPASTSGSRRNPASRTKPVVVPTPVEDTAEGKLDKPVVNEEVPAENSAESLIEDDLIPADNEHE